MSKLNFKTTAQVKEKDYGEFFLEPLPQGYGHTLGNALRRVLLSSLHGAAITRVKIKGIRHPFRTLPGLKNDIIELLLNIKKIRIKILSKETGKEKSYRLKLEAHGPGEFKAAKITSPAQLEIVNKDLKLGYLANKKSKIEMEMQVEEGIGYRPSSEESEETGVIPLDAIFTPILRVAYRVEETRVGQRTDFDRLILKIWTDGTIDPQKALEEAAKILVGYFHQVYEPVVEEKKVVEEILPLDIAHLTIEELGLPTRIANALKRSNFKTVRDLSVVSQKDIEKAKSIGQKSLKIIKRKLKEKGIELKE